MVNERVTSDDWVAAARKALIESGIDDVKIDVLARKLKVTRGSFYWHFKKRQDLLDTLLKDWESNNHREITEIERYEESGRDGLIEVFRIWLSEDPTYPAFDIAIRVWARKSRVVSKIVHAIDRRWIALIQSYMERSGIEPPESIVRARVMYFHQIGYFALSMREKTADRAILAPYYYSVFVGAPPPDTIKELLREFVKPNAGSRRNASPARKAAPDRAEG